MGRVLLLFLVKVCAFTKSNRSKHGTGSLFVVALGY